MAIARVLALDSPIMLMDEPFGALDALTSAIWDELLRIWEKLGKTILFVTHSIEESIYLADRIVVMTYRPGTVKRDQRVDMPRRPIVCRVPPQAQAGRVGDGGATAPCQCRDEAGDGGLSTVSKALKCC